MVLTWTVLRCPVPTGTAPWTPAGATWWDAGASSPGHVQAPVAVGVWWSVVATWADAGAAGRRPVVGADVSAWHLVLEPRSAHGELVLPRGARPFDGVPSTGQLTGPVALVTVAGPSPDGGREREFSRRFGHVARDIGDAPGHVVSLVHAPPGGSGPVLTLSVWDDLAAGRDWAYTHSRPHTSAVARQRSHGLVSTSGSLRCTVLASTGSLGDLGDPLAGRTTAAPPAPGTSGRSGAP